MISKPDQSRKGAPLVKQTAATSKLKIVFLLSILVGLTYIVLRIYDLWDFYFFLLGRTYQNTFVKSTPFFFIFAELFIVAEMALFVWVHSQKMETQDSPTDLFNSIAPENLPKISVLIPTFREPPEVVAQTALGAALLNYPKEKFEVLVLDDENSPARKRAIEALAINPNNQPVHYYSRIGEGRPHTGFKAGNLNYGLEKISSETELILMLDADHIPKQDALRSLLPFAMEICEGRTVLNSSFGFAQAPQTYRWKSFDPWDRPSRSFHLATQRYRAAKGAVMLTGTSALVSVKALKAIGGFDTATVTEDLFTGAKIQGLGLKSYYCQNEVAYGEVPQTIPSILRQRLRWATGSFQFLRNWQNATRGLSLTQKFTYLSGVLQFMVYIPLFLFSLLPVSSVLFQWDPVITIRPSTALFLLLTILVRTFVFCSSRGFFIYEIITGVYLPFFYAPIFFLGLLQGLTNKKIDFWVTPKAHPSIETKPDSIVLPIFAVFFLNLSSFLYLNFAMLYSARSWNVFLSENSFIYSFSLFICLCFICAWPATHDRDDKHSDLEKSEAS